jgi:F-type H+-transporting ATPase subunit gamma
MQRPKAMSQIIQLKHKIKAIETTKKITHAIRLVSMSLYTKLDKKYSAFKYHVEYMERYIDRLLPEYISNNQILDTLYPTHKERYHSLIIIVGTTKGLCGSLNSNLFRFIKTLDQKAKLIVIGQKALVFARKQGLESSILYSYKELNSKNFVSMADDLFEKITSDKNPFKEVIIFSNYYKTFFIQTPKKHLLIPLSLSKKNGSGKDDFSIWEQSPKKTHKYMLSMYLRSKIMNILFEALIAEQTARFLTMDGSTNNAENFLAKLTIEFNKQRQSLITKEVSELSTALLND